MHAYCIYIQRKKNVNFVQLSKLTTIHTELASTKIKIIISKLVCRWNHVLQLKPTTVQLFILGCNLAINIYIYIPLIVERSLVGVAWTWLISNTTSPTPTCSRPTSSSNSTSKLQESNKYEHFEMDLYRQHQQRFVYTDEPLILFPL